MKYQIEKAVADIGCGVCVEICLDFEKLCAEYRIPETFYAEGAVL